MVGRSWPLAQLEAALADPARVPVVLRGPAGIGKSRLAEEAVDRGAPDAWRARASAPFRHSPLAPFALVAPHTITGSSERKELIRSAIAAIEAGANRVDAASAGLGAGAGNTPMEVLVAVLDLMGVETGVDTFKIQDVAEDLVVPIMDFPIRIDRDALTLGYAGVYGSFLLFAKRAEKKYGVPAREILVELGRKGMVGGQEDMIEDLALTMAKQKGHRA